jgi:phosphoglycolate phosphatase-like HAD superfamily hydrolase
VRAVKRSGARVVVFTDAPEVLARIALAHLGLARAVDRVEAGRGARERAAIGARVVESSDGLTADSLT